MSLVESISQERQIRNQLAEPVAKALARPGAVVPMGNSQHVTITPLLEIAGLLGFGVEVTPAVFAADPLHPDDTLATCVATATRPDGVRFSESGSASTSETVTLRETGEEVQRWTDTFALQSMAATRAKVRCLTSVLMPVVRAISEQHGQQLSFTPAEMMPPDGAHT